MTGKPASGGTFQRAATLENASAPRGLTAIATAVVLLVFIRDWRRHR
jgi:hypothetical protein